MKTKIKAIVKGYLLSSLGCLGFGLVYECFSHQVYSPFMLCAFLIPLLGGEGVFALPGLARWERWPGPFSRALWHSGLAALTVGSLFRGVLDIYGTTSRLSAVYWAVGAALLASARGTYAAGRAKRALRR